MTLTTDEHLDRSLEAGDSFTASFNVEILKAEESDDGKVGRVEAIVSAFNVDYRMGFFTWHRIVPGAFDESIAKQATIPLFFQHNWDWSEQPPVGTGVASATTEPKPGLKVAGEFFLDTPSGLATFRAIKAGALREWSIGYRIQDWMVKEDDDNNRKVIVVSRAELWEASSVLRGANPDTETLMVAKQMPAEWAEMISDGFKSVADALASVCDRLDRFEEGVTDLADRVDGIEAAHEVLVGSLEDSNFKVTAGSGEPVELAAGGGGESETEDVGTPPAGAPGSPSGETAADRIARAEQRAKDRVASKWEKFVEQAGAGLDNPDADEHSRSDLASMERVVRCLNGAKAQYDAVEHTVTARVLAESASSET